MMRTVRQCVLIASAIRETAQRRLLQKTTEYQHTKTNAQLLQQKFAQALVNSETTDLVWDSADNTENHLEHILRHPDEAKKYLEEQYANITRCSSKDAC